MATSLWASPRSIAMPRWPRNCSVLPPVITEATVIRVRSRPASSGDGRPARLIRGDLRPPRGEELANLVPVIHDPDSRGGREGVGVPTGGAQ